MADNFHFAKTPEIHFGAGKFSLTGRLTKKFGSNVLVVTGAESLKKSGKSDDLVKQFRNEDIKFSFVSIHNEPNPDFIDDVTKRNRTKGIKVVIAVGGGSVVDAGKAISAMLPVEDSIFNYLEDVGNKIHSGVKIPFIAIPTTSGTGSETTKNAVLSSTGENGFKKSLRHDNFVPDIAIVDPELTLTLPPHITAACGMDAFTQLLESYVSTKASLITDSLAFEGLHRIRDALLSACTTHQRDVEVRSSMSYASMISGITLANAGLGTVHGFASAIGGYFNIPHGVVCGTLMGTVSRKTIELLTETDTQSIAFKKFARVGKMFIHSCNNDDIYYALKLADIIDEWTEILDIPKLGAFGIKESHFKKIINATGNKNNPVNFGKSELTAILKNRL